MRETAVYAIYCLANGSPRQRPKVTHCAKVIIIVASRPTPRYVDSLPFSLYFTSDSERSHPSNTDFSTIRDYSPKGTISSLSNGYNTTQPVQCHTCAPIQMKRVDFCHKGADGREKGLYHFLVCLALSLWVVQEVRTLQGFETGTLSDRMSRQSAHNVLRRGTERMNK